MRVCHVITGLADGGAEAVLSRLAVSSISPRATSVIVLGSAGKHTKTLHAASIDVSHLDMPRGRLTISGVWRLYLKLRQERPDIVQTWMYHGDLVGGVVAWLSGRKNIFWNVRHTELHANATGRTTRIVARLCAWLSWHVPVKIVACASRARDVHVELGYDPSKFVIIPNGFDLQQMSPDLNARLAIRRELAVGDVPLIGLVGRWNPQKDHQNLIEAVAGVRRDRPCALVLVGSGCDAENAALRVLIEGAGLSGHVHLLGRRTDVPAIMNALDLHVLSSSHGEAFPNVVAEAMACGTPCVVTDVGDAAEIVGDTGWVVPPSDSAALARAITEALAEQSNIQVWQSRQQRARQRVVENFSLEKMVSAYQSIWSRAQST